MGLSKLLFGWPLAPIDLLIRLGKLIEEQVELYLRDPASVRRRLEEVEEARAAGLMSEEEAAHATEEILQQLMA